MDLVMTDERLYRDSHPCGEETTDKYFTPGARDKCGYTNHARRHPEALLPEQDRKFTPEVEGLGQRDDGHAAQGGERFPSRGADEVFSDVAQDSNGDGVYTSLDQWDGYQAERQEISRRVRDAGTDNFVAITVTYTPL